MTDSRVAQVFNGGELVLGPVADFLSGGKNSDRSLTFCLEEGIVTGR